LEDFVYKTLALLSIMLSQLSMSGTTPSVDQAPSPALIAAAQTAFPEYDLGPTLDYVISTTSEPKQSVSVTRSVDPSPGGGPSPTASKYPGAHIKRMVMDADFVGAATILNSWSYPTDKNGFIFTIYLVHVDAVAVGDGGGVKAGQDIYVTRAGGQIEYKGHPAVATDPYFDLFNLKTTYVFFGKRIGSSLYKVNSDGSLEEKDGLVKETNKRNPHSFQYRGRDAKSVLDEAFSAWQELPSSNTRSQND
jgi:hypothetical protein